MIQVSRTPPSMYCSEPVILRSDNGMHLNFTDYDCMSPFLAPSHHVCRVQSEVFGDEKVAFPTALHSSKSKPGVAI